MAKQGQADRFHQGTMTDGWRWFGAHPAKKRGRDGWTFRVWAPHAEAVSVVGDFNDWEEGAAPSPARARSGRAFCRTCRSILPINMRCGGRTARSARRRTPTASTQNPAGDSQQAV